VRRGPQPRPRTRRRGDRGDKSVTLRRTRSLDDSGRPVRHEGWWEQASRVSRGQRRSLGPGSQVGRPVLRECRPAKTLLGRSRLQSGRPSAARPASAIPPLWRRSPTRINEPGPRCGGGALGNRKLRGRQRRLYEPTPLRRRRCVVARRSRGSRDARRRQGAASASTAKARRSNLARHLADQPRDRDGHSKEHQQEDVHAAIGDCSGDGEMGGKIASRAGSPSSGDDRSTYVQESPYLEGMAERIRDRGHRRRPRARPLHRLDHDRTTFAGPDSDQGGEPGRGICCANHKCPAEGLQPVTAPDAATTSDDARHFATSGSRTRWCGRRRRA